MPSRLHGRATRPVTLSGWPSVTPAGSVVVRTRSTVDRSPAMNITPTWNTGSPAAVRCCWSVPKATRGSGTCVQMKLRVVVSIGRSMPAPFSLLPGVPAACGGSAGHLDACSWAWTAPRGVSEDLAVAGWRAAWWALVAAVVTCAGAVPAGAATQSRVGDAFAPATASAVLHATASDGTPVAFDLQLDQAAMTASEIGGSASAPPDEAYFAVEIGGSEASVGPRYVPILPVAASAFTLAYPGGTASATVVGAAGFGLFSGLVYFLVPDTVTTATLEIGSASVEADTPDGGPTTLSTEPLTIEYTDESVTAVATPPGAAARSMTNALGGGHVATGTSMPVLAVGLTGAAAGATVVVVVIPLLIRRRSYRKADAEGRVLVAAPPAPHPSQPSEESAEPGAMVATDPPMPVEHRSTVFVRLFGEHTEVEGLSRPIGAGPRELLDYLAAHPGTESSSARLRAVIWCDPRAEITPATFTNYLSALRKALPAGSLVRSEQGRRHRLSDAVSSDWALFSALVADHGPNRTASLRSALDLVRGRPFAWAESAPAGAYGWALGGLTTAMERAIESAAHELVDTCLEVGDLDGAHRAVRAGLRGTTFSSVLEEGALRVAAAADGELGVRRGMAEARVRLGDDAQLLEATARGLGWSGW